MMRVLAINNNSRILTDKNMLTKGPSPKWLARKFVGIGGL